MLFNWIVLALKGFSEALRTKADRRFGVVYALAIIFKVDTSQLLTSFGNEQRNVLGLITTK